MRDAMSEHPQIVNAAASRSRGAWDRPFLVGFLLFASPLMIPLWIWLYRRSFWVGGAVSLVIIGSLFLLLRRWLGTLVGPMFFYDVVRIARRGRSFLLRCVYVLLLLAGFCQAYGSHFHGDPWRGAFSPRSFVPLRDLARFNHTFVLTFLIAQAAAVLVLTPVYLASAIAEEKERQTLALLFTTHLRDYEIILGKLFARLAHLGQLLLAGLPIFLLLSVAAGNEVIVLTAATLVVTAMTLLSLGSVSILCSVSCRHVLTATVSSFGCLLAFQIACFTCCPGPLMSVSSPIAFPLVLNERLDDPVLPVPALRRPTAPGIVPTTPVSVKSSILPITTDTVINMTISYVVLHGAVSLICIALAIRRLRPLGLASLSPASGPIRPRLVPISNVFAAPDEIALPPVVEEPKRRWLPPVDGRHPLLWKEMFLHPPSRIALGHEVLLSVWVVAAGLALLFLPLILAASESFNWQPFLRLANGLLRVLVIVLTGAWCIGVGMRTAGSFSRERDRRTLAMLLMIPADRQVILHAKWWGGILRLRMFAWALLGLWLLGLLTTTLHPLGALLLAGSCAVFVAFFASLGVWLSQACRNTRAAHLCMALMLLMLFGASWLPLMDPAAPGELTAEADDKFGQLYQVGLNPMISWWLAAFSWREWHEAIQSHDGLFWPRLRAILHGTAVLGGLAVVFWLAARRRLYAEPQC